MPFSVVQNTTLGRCANARSRSARRKSIPLITGMFQSSRITSGVLSRHASSASRPSPASVTRSEEHTSELQSLMRISYAVFCLKKKKNHKKQNKILLLYKYIHYTTSTQYNHIT